MFPDAGGQTGFTTSAMNQQNASLLGNPQIQQAAAMPAINPNVMNTTAPQSSAVNPAIAHMVNALKGGVQ